MLTFETCFFKGCTKKWSDDPMAEVSISGDTKGILIELKSSTPSTWPDLVSQIVLSETFRAIKKVAVDCGILSKILLQII